MKLGRRAAILQSYERLCTYIAGEIRYTAAPIADILSAAAAETGLEPLKPFLSRFSPQEDWRVSFQEGIQQDLTGQGLEATDLSLIRGFGEGLGATDVAGQLAHCRQFEERLREQAAAARQQMLVKGKLYTSLGVAGGLVVTLLWL